MIDGRYTEQEWLNIELTLPRAAGANQARGALEAAAAQYDEDRQTTVRMLNAASKRNQWSDIHRQGEKLLQSINAIGDWLPPVWGDDGQPDFLGHRAQLVERLSLLLAHAQENVWTYDSQAKRHAGQQDPDRDRLFSCVLKVWTDDLGAELKVSNSSGKTTGPLIRFFDAAVSPILGRETPKPNSVRDIVKRERDRSRSAARQPSASSSAPSSTTSNA